MYHTDDKVAGFLSLVYTINSCLTEKSFFNMQFEMHFNDILRIGLRINFWNLIFSFGPDFLLDRPLLKWVQRNLNI